MPALDKRDSAVCSLCVQWRCAKYHDDPCPDSDMDCIDQHGFEPYWPDGSVAVVTQTDPCPRCAESMATYYAEQEANPW